jgi:glycosyltransferase involved in cell wall biosynthesis
MTAVNVEPSAMQNTSASSIRPRPRSISIVVTAMNEEGNLKSTVNGIVRAVAPRFPIYEIIIVDDGSRDRTASIADELALTNPSIHVQRNVRNRGLAYSYRRGIELATCEFTSWVAGNNLVPAEAFERIYDAVGRRDMVVTFILRDVRGRRRRTLSRAFNRIVNALFGFDLKYYTGPCVYRTDAVKRLRMRTEGSMFVAEVLLRLLNSGQSYEEVGLQPLPRTSGSTKSFRVRNIVNVASSIILLFWELRVKERLVPSHVQPEVPVAESDRAVSSR